ncbi:MAG TPA: hypothetical protein VM324_08140, partial [Egibacteraceae bacterium]|nr:hypothetical protein [Egibacteraceae bacterium]
MRYETYVPRAGYPVRPPDAKRARDLDDDVTAPLDRPVPASTTAPVSAVPPMTSTPPAVSRPPAPRVPAASP